jgi:hypothetical protein
MTPKDQIKIHFTENLSEKKTTKPIQITENSNHIDTKDKEYIKNIMKKYNYTEYNKAGGGTATAKINYNKVDIHSNDNSYRSTNRKIMVDVNSKDNTVLEKKDINATLFIENGFCLDCMIDIPLRTKHCATCNKCIATFDHHCYWVGNCIGENNKRYFLIFLLIHSISIGLAITLV